MYDIDRLETRPIHGETAISQAVQHIAVVFELYRRMHALKSRWTISIGHPETPEVTRTSNSDRNRVLSVMRSSPTGRVEGAHSDMSLREVQWTWKSIDEGWMSIVWTDTCW
jgi:hypothetical protein